MIDLQTTQFALAGFKGVSCTPATRATTRPGRVFNGMIDRYPAIMARCRDAADVAAAVGLARSTGYRSRSTEGVMGSRAPRSAMVASAST